MVKSIRDTIFEYLNCNGPPACRATFALLVVVVDISCLGRFVESQQNKTRKTLVSFLNEFMGLRSMSM